MAATSGLNFRNYQVIVESQEDGTDGIALHVVGESSTNTTELAARIRSATGVSM